MSKIVNALQVAGFNELDVGTISTAKSYEFQPLQSGTNWEWSTVNGLGVCQKSHIFCGLAVCDFATE